MTSKSSKENIFFLPGSGSTSGFSIRIPNTDPETQLKPDPTGFGSETLVTNKIN
jgi:hypothetical protein